MQKIAKYYAMFDPAEEGGYNVFFPDFPGCVTFGRTFEEAHEMAREVLDLWIEDLRDRNLEIPFHSGRPIIDEVIVSFA